MGLGLIGLGLGGCLGLMLGWVGWLTMFYLGLGWVADQVEGVEQQREEFESDL